MKVFVVWVLHFVVVALLAGPVLGEDLGYVVAGPDGAGGVQAEAAVDVAALVRNGAVKDAAWYAKPFVAVREIGGKAVDVVKQNPGKTALTVVAVVITHRAVEGKLEDDWKRLCGGSTTGKSGSEPDEPSLAYATETAVVVQNEINGDGNSIQQNIVIQAPQGDGAGMAGNAGTVAGGE